MRPALALLLALLGSSVFAQNKLDPAHVEFFENKIRPVLVEHCYRCHSAEAEKNKKLKAELRVDSRQALAKGGESGPAVVPGDLKKSLLVQALYHVDLSMPPSGKLPANVIADFEKWVKMGAPDPRDETVKVETKSMDFAKAREFWSFQLPKNQTPPTVKDAAWPKKELDRFILAKLEEKGLKPVPFAEKRQWIRRATFDLLGLPPSADDVEAFLRDESPGAYAKVVDRLLASPHYGERWGRYWLDVARYAEDQAHTFGVKPYTNAHRYRDWVIQAFNDDLGYDQFLKLQIAGDLMPEMPDRFKQLAGLGYQGLGAQYYKNTDAAKAAADELDDRIDSLTRGILGLTVSCARCHDHKFDPIPQVDYYSLAGIYNGSSLKEVPLASAPAVKAYDDAQAKIKVQNDKIAKWLAEQGQQLRKHEAGLTAKYVAAAWKTIAREQNKKPVNRLEIAKTEGLKLGYLGRWVTYLDAKNSGKASILFEEWFKTKREADELPAEIAQLAERVQKDLQVALAGYEKLDAKKQEQVAKSPPKKKGATVKTILPGDGDELLRALVLDAGSPFALGPNEVRFALKDLETMKTLKGMDETLATLTKASPPKYDVAHGIAGGGAVTKVFLRGNPAKPGDVAPPRFLQVISTEAKPEKYTRLELANDLASNKNPLTARVWVNRVWQYHFGKPLVATPSNFGHLGEKPTHPELLDHLAVRFMESGWSNKTLHREIMLSSTYRLSTQSDKRNFAVDADNDYLWRMHRRRLDVEAWRDSMLAVSGKLDASLGGPTLDLNAANNRRRTVYAKISRHELNSLLRLFDFPDANITSEKRTETTVPQQQLFVLNSQFVVEQAKALAARLNQEASQDGERVDRAFRMLFSRPATPQEIALATQFLAAPDSADDQRQNKLSRWERFAQILLGSNEFLYLD